MILVTAAMALPVQLAAGRVGAWQRRLQVASGAVSVAFGLLMVHQIGVVDGLFTGAPSWTPR
jgi:high-affinity nickel-transport protein